MHNKKLVNACLKLCSAEVLTNSKMVQGLNGSYTLQQC